MADQQEISGFEPGQTAIPPGVTLAMYVVDPPYTSGGMMKYLSGGSLLLMKAPGIGGVGNFGYGQTLSAATLAADYSAGRYYVMDGAPIAYDGAARYYLAAIGATAVVQFLRGLSPGYQQPNP